MNFTQEESCREFNDKILRMHDEKDTEVSGISLEKLDELLEEWEDGNFEGVFTLSWSGQEEEADKLAKNTLDIREWFDKNIINSSIDNENCA